MNGCPACTQTEAHWMPVYLADMDCIHLETRGNDPQLCIEIRRHKVQLGINYCPYCGNHLRHKGIAATIADNIARIFRKGGQEHD